MLQLELFRNRGFASANAVSFFMYAGLFGSLFLMTQLLQFAQGHSPLSAGIRMLPWTAAPGVVSPIAGALADRIGNRPFLIVGLAMQAIGLGWIAAVVTADMSYTQLGLAFGVAGIGIGMVFPTVANGVLGSVPLAAAGVASGTNGTVRELGGVLGVAVLAAVLARRGNARRHSLSRSPCPPGHRSGRAGARLCHRLTNTRRPSNDCAHHWNNR